MFNLTAVNPSAVSYLTAYPNGVTRPFASNVNVVAGTTTPNLVTVGIGAEGSVALYNNQGSTDVLADVVGYYSPDSTLQFTGITPGRLFDTRNGLGRPAGKVAGNTSITTPVTYYGVPSDAQAVVTHATATRGSTNGDYVTTYPTGQSAPLASTLNADAGSTVANLAVLPVGSGNSISLYNRIGTIDLLDDITGYYSPTYGDTTTPTSPPVYTPPPPKALGCSARMSNRNPRPTATSTSWSNLTPEVLTRPLTGSAASLAPQELSVIGSRDGSSRVEIIAARFIGSGRRFALPPSGSRACWLRNRAVSGAAADVVGPVSTQDPSHRVRTSGLVPLLRSC